MADFFTQLTAWFESLILVVGYPGIAFGMFAENLFPPVPTDPLLPFAGILAAQGHLTLFGVWLAAVTGATVGALALYAIGRWAGEPVIRRMVRRWGRWVGLDEGELERALAFFARYGAAAVFVGRMTPVLRSAVSLVAGMSRMSAWVFLPATAISSGLATLLWISLGYFLGENWREFITLIGQIPLWIWVIGGIAGVAVLAGVLWWRWRKTPDAAKAEESE